MWRTIFWGMLVQVCFGMFILRTEAGFEAFNWLGNFAQTFINFVDAGVEFVYGESWPDHSFAFKVWFCIKYFFKEALLTEDWATFLVGGLG